MFVLQLEQCVGHKETKLLAETKKPMTIAVDVTYAVLAHDISPDVRIRANSCIEISKYN